MILQSGEQMLGREAMDGIWQGVLQPGILHLTNRRLVFEGSVWEAGVGWVPKTIVDLALIRITNITTSADPKGIPVMRIEAGPGWAYSFKSPRVPHWADSIRNWSSHAVSQIPPPPPPVAGPPSGGVVVNVPQPQVFLHCRHCGTLNPAATLRCSSCGASL